jgi:hypothetical protein
MAEAQRQSEVRRQVRQLLEASPAYRSLGVDDRRDLANNMVKVGTYLADPSWLDDSNPTRAAALAESEPVQDLKGRLADKPGQVGAEFKAGALKQGVEEFGNLVQKVDFPAFVSGLVQGVFKAVVDASIEQMQAYAELMAAAVKSTEQFANDHISDGEVRDQIAARYPGQVQIDTSGPVSRLRISEDAADLDLARDYGLGDSVDLSDRESEARLVTAAKLELARSRQQMTATMMLLGINRIVITDGKINAKVVFDIQADDSASRKASAAMHDATTSDKESGGGSFSLTGWGAKASYDKARSSHRTTVSSSVDDTSQSKAAMKAQLTGDVKLSFKSETFPLERMVDAGGLALLNARATPTTPTPPTPKT